MAALAVVLALIAGAWWLALGDDAPAAERGAAGPAGTDEEWDLLGGGPERPARARDDAPAEPAPAREGRPGRPGVEAQRAEWQERWRRAVTIAALGARPPAFTPDAIREALAPARERLRECVTESGGWRGLFEARRAQWAARLAAEPAPAGGEPPARPRSRVSFQVRPDGTVDPATLAFDPPMPDAYRPCFEAHFTSLRLDDAGDGARVELPMGPPRGARPRPADGGVPAWRGRGEWPRRGAEGSPAP